MHFWLPKLGSLLYVFDRVTVLIINSRLSVIRRQLPYLVPQFEGSVDLCVE